MSTTRTVFNDGIVGMGKDFPPPDTAPEGTSTGGVRRGGPSSPTKTELPADTTTRRNGVRRGRGPSTREPRQQGAGPIRPQETRSSRRVQPPTPPTSRGGPSPAQTDSPSRQRRSGIIRQEQRSVSTAETTVKKGGGFVSRIGGRPLAGPAGTGESVGGKNSPRPRRQGSSPTRQEAGGRPAPATTPARSGGAMAPPGQAGTGRISYSGSARRSRDRSPSPARQELARGAIPRGTLQRGGAPSIHPGLAGTGSHQTARTTSQMKQRSTSPVRQEPAKTPTPASPPVKGGGPIVHTSSPPVRTDSPSRQRSSSPIRQEPVKAPASASPSMKSGSPIIRPGPAGTIKGPPAPKRSTRSKPDASKQGGNHGKPGT